MMRTPATVQRSAWLLLLAFVVGTVLVPVVHHSFHPHGVEDVQAAPTDESALKASVQAKAAFGCVICNTPVAAHSAPILELHSRLPVDELTSSVVERVAHESGTGLSARAPPAA